MSLCNDTNMATGGITVLTSFFLRPIIQIVSHCAPFENHFDDFVQDCGSSSQVH